MHVKRNEQNRLDLALVMTFLPMLFGSIMSNRNLGEISTLHASTSTDNDGG
jgi:hypothetical protein